MKYQSESVIVGSGCICGYLLFSVSCGHITRESLCLECFQCIAYFAVRFTNVKCISLLKLFLMIDD